MICLIIEKIEIVLDYEWNISHDWTWSAYTFRNKWNYLVYGKTKTDATTNSITHPKKTYTFRMKWNQTKNRWLDYSEN